MTVTDPSPAVVDDGEPLLLRTDPPRLGPTSRILLGRLVALVALIQLVGAVLVFAVDGHTATAAGLGLVFPGAGLLYDAAPLAFAATLVLMVVALVLWWGLSAHAAIPIVWFGSAAVAAALADGPRLWVDDGTHWGWAIPVAYAAAVATVARMVWRFERRYQAKKAKIPELNAYLAEGSVPEKVRDARLPDDMDAELVRWCYDLAFQPDDGLKGLDWGEQFHGGTQLRYQLNTFSWALSVFAANYVPNAPHQVERALSKLIDKHTDLRVWRYWRTLNLLGNFDANPDPIVRDNIMFSAFLGDVINMYEAVTGSDRYDQPGSLTFTWSDGRTFAYDHHTLVDAIKDNYDRSRLGFFPCEPGWSFTVCNIMGAQSLRGHETLHGSDRWREVAPRWEQTLDDEYLTPDGSYAHIRSNHLGLSWDTGEVPGGHYFANGTNRFADILPDHAARARALELRNAPAKMGALAAKLDDDGRLEMELPETPERHRTRSSALPGWTGIVAGARATGHAALAEAALGAAARQCGTDERWPERPLKAGASGLAGHMLVRWSTPHSTADLNVRGYQPPQGPIVASLPWDDVIVVLARSDDGESLDLVVEPWHADTLTVEIGFGSLRPGEGYQLADGTVTGSEAAGSTVVLADDLGRATATVALEGRTHLRLVPGGAS
ncbi:MAG: hypothetical protein ACRBI6_00590 [Acidimicrobiales bacterium]